MLCSCGSSKVFVPNPPGQSTPPPDTKEHEVEVEKPPAGPRLEGGLDFAVAFTDSTIEEVPVRELSRERERTPHREARAADASLRSPSFSVPSTMVRVALRRDVADAVLYTVGLVDVKGADGTRAARVRGRVALRSSKVKDRVSLAMRGAKESSFALPCTLLSRNSHNYIEIDTLSYRGSIVLVGSRTGRFSFVNYLEVEDYLRGVVPLEMGPRSEEVLEALKAQAVAARTYTYRRMENRLDSSYDLLPTVADQVYGGVNVEYRESDMAVRATRGLVMTHDDELVDAYYHSTCGGRTANIEDVWNKPPRPYLRSVSDLNGEGDAYCAASRYSTWRQSWSRSRLATILSQYAPGAAGSGTFRGRFTSINVLMRYRCGRIRTLKVGSSRGNAVFSGDKIRFAFRRDTPGNPILPSANFDVASVTSRELTLRGHGYGHGVGMCQMGALGRAQEGQRFDQILKAYYTGVEIRRARER